MKGEEKGDNHWDDEISRIGLSSDGVPIVYSLPGLLLAPDQVGSTYYCLLFPNDIYSGALVPSAHANG